MKKYIIIIVVSIFSISVKSQVKSLYDDEYAAIRGAYYKDIYNDLDKYVGTWKYSDGSKSLMISIRKKVNQHFLNQTYEFYEDVLIGEYVYIEDNDVKANTISRLDLNLGTNEHSIFGSNIIGPESQYCINCDSNDRKVLLEYVDPSRIISGYTPEMIFERADSNGTPKLKLKFRTISGYIVVDGVQPEFTEYTIPFGEYILTKIN